jgi:hypothetical protein
MLSYQQRDHIPTKLAAGTRPLVLERSVFPDEVLSPVGRGAQLITKDPYAASNPLGILYVLIP